jgi:excisionase family DNA binding protein
MPQPFRQQIVEYRLNGKCRTPDGKRVTKNTPGAERIEYEAAKWYGEYVDRDGKAHRVPLSESKETSKRMLSRLVAEAELGSVGIEEKWSKPLSEHLDDFRRHVAANNRTKDHVTRTVNRCKAVLDGCEFYGVSDLQPSAVVEFLAGMREGRGLPELVPAQEWYTAAELAAVLGVKQASVWRMVHRGLIASEGTHRKRRFSREAVLAAVQARCPGIATSNHYLVAIKAFTKWLSDADKIPKDPLKRLKKLNAEVDVRHCRRALAQDEFTSFVTAARSGKPFRGLSGPDRAFLYTVATQTGLRASELASLTLGSFDLGSETPAVTVEAAYSKHRRRDVQPLRPDVAELVREFLAGRDRKARLWPGTWPEAGAEMVRLDLAAAGIAYQDDAGRFYDFHALRHQFISNLAAAGVHPKVAQELARHSTIELTMRVYTHLQLRDKGAALDKLPPPPPADPTASPLNPAESTPKRQRA